MNRSTKTPLRLITACAGITLLFHTATAAHAAVFTIDDQVSGAVYDGTLDGFPLPPPGIPPDGVGDLVGNPLGVALQAGVTEQRAIIELPLATLAGVAPGDVVSATLSFNIDDVVSTFGPGTTFDGTAADTFFLFGYDGNGTIDLADFGDVAGAPLAIVDTTSHGIITDASLAASGPIAFDIDVTAAVSAHLSAGDAFMGVVIATDDNASATSLDNLGNAGAGPPGVNGSFLPYLTVVTAEPAPPAYSRDEQACQKAIAKAGVAYLKAVQTSLAKCMNAVLVTVGKGGDASSESAKCQDAADPDSSDSKVAKAAQKARDAITGGCSELTPAAIDGPCLESATTFEQVADCIVAGHTALGAQAVAQTYGAACALLAAVGLDADYAAACED
jgi:hypothetical protein